MRPLRTSFQAIGVFGETSPSSPPTQAEAPWPSHGQRDASKVRLVTLLRTPRGLKRWDTAHSPNLDHSTSNAATCTHRCL